MPYRITPLVKGETYHIYNRSIAREPLFLTPKDYMRITELISFYIYAQTSLRFSHYNKLSIVERQLFTSNLRTHPKLVTVFSYCLMPNHFHFLLRAEIENGITEFISRIQNGYAKYHNTKTKRHGALFESMYKAVHIETDEQLLHVSRYIHLNPLTSFVISKQDELPEYEWCSYRNYIGFHASEFVDISFILKMFSSIEEFKAFTLNQADYQRYLNQIRHLLYEDP